MQRTLKMPDYFQYIRLVRSAKLKGREKTLLRTYIDWYWWEDGQPCIYGFAQLGAWAGMSESSAKRAHRRLEELGWIRVVKYRSHDPLRTYLAIGSSDPEYDNEGYAQAHRFSDSGEELLWKEQFLASEDSSNSHVAPIRSHRPKRGHRESKQVTPTFK